MWCSFTDYCRTWGRWDLTLFRRNRCINGWLVTFIVWLSLTPLKLSRNWDRSISLEGFNYLRNRSVKYFCRKFPPSQKLAIDLYIEYISQFIKKISITKRIISWRLWSVENTLDLERKIWYSKRWCFIPYQKLRIYGFSQSHPFETSVDSYLRS